MCALWFDVYERTTLLVKHMRVEHNGGGCPCLVVAPRICFPQLQLLSAVSDSSHVDSSVFTVCTLS